MKLENKIDFMAFITVNKANPNGDPLSGNRPREDYNGYGEISDVCIKRKIRNRLQDMGERIFVQSNDRCDDGCKSLKDRVESETDLKNFMKKKDKDSFVSKACETWIDVRSFGQVFAFKSDKLSVGIRGPVSIHMGISVSPIDILELQITKSVNGETKKGGNDEPENVDEKSSDTMGMKYMVDFGLYVIKGSINCQLAEKTGFSVEDSEKIKKALGSLFENDCSSARPDGSMEVKKVFWWKHSCYNGNCSSAKVYNSVKIDLKEGISVPSKYEDYDISTTPLEGIEFEVIEGR